MVMYGGDCDEVEMMMIVMMMAVVVNDIIINI